MFQIIAIAAGGAIGAVLRHFASGAAMKFLGTAFPYGALCVNILGSFLLGCLISWFAAHEPASLHLRAFLSVGLLGAFTTFSTFSLDVVVLMERGAYQSAVFYILGNVALGVISFFFGMKLLQALL